MPVTNHAARGQVFALASLAAAAGALLLASTSFCAIGHCFMNQTMQCCQQQDLFVAPSGLCVWVWGRMGRGGWGGGGI